MRRSERPPGSPALPRRPDLLPPEESPPPVYRSFFEEECRAIAGRLRLGAAEEPSPGPWESSDPWPDAAGLLTSTPLGAPPPPRPATGGCRAAVPDPAGEEPRRPPQRAAGGGSRPLRGAARPSPADRSPGRGRSLLRARAAAAGTELPEAGEGTRAAPSAGAKAKLLPAAKSRLRRPGAAPQPAQPSAIPKAAPRARRTEAAAKAGGRSQPARGVPSAIPAAAARARARPLPNAAPKRLCLGSPWQQRICNRTWELKESSGSTEETVLGADKADQTWGCAGSSFSSKLAPGPTPGCGAVVTAEQCAGDRLSQELKRVKKELERVRGELADKTAQCDAYRRTISSLQAQLRAAGICPEDAAVEQSGGWRRD